MTIQWPNSTELEKAAKQSRRIESTLRVDILDGYVLLIFIAHGSSDELQVEAGYTIHYAADYSGQIPKLSEKPNRSPSSIGHGQRDEHYMWRDDSIANSLAWLAEDWSHGSVDFSFMNTKAKEPYIDGLELESLTLASWMEAFGKSVPESNALLAQVKQARQEHNDLRAECLEWLRSGSEGVERWNDLRNDQRTSVGNLGKCQFNGYYLSGALFGNQELRESDFSEANLQKSNFGGADCQLASFRSANLCEAWMSGGKFLETDFSQANMTKAALRATRCAGANFRETDLTGVDFSFADLRGVDLSTANLTEADLFRIKYDEQTVFPDDFVITPEQRMEWKGAVDRPDGYTSNASLEQLRNLIPPPASPKNATSDWDKVEDELGIVFPSDFKELVRAYGSGCILSGLCIYNPLTADGKKLIAEQIEMLEDFRESAESPWPIHPEESGLLPWGSDSNGNCYCWLTTGQPDDWATGQLADWSEDPESDEVNITTFLLNFARNKYPEMLGGLEFEESDYKFTPH